MSEFAVGELAIFVDPCGAHDGKEVTVIGPLGMRHTSEGYLETYAIDGPFGPPPSLGWCASPDQLRKRRPPQDWKTLCRLDEVPSDCLGERELVT